MRILGIETSSVRGSVALVEGAETVAVASHEREGAHDASLQPLIDQVLREAGWRATQLDRIAVGTGPGSFTGLRVGIALAQGISEGLGIPLVGVGSLQAMAAAAPGASSQLRVPLLDARRGEYFLAAYSPDGRERLPPQIAVDAASVERLVAGLSGGVLLLGRAWDASRSQLPHHSSDETDLPHARWTARVASSVEPTAAVLPVYLRPPVAVVPQLAARLLSVEMGPDDVATEGRAENKEVPGERH